MRGDMLDYTISTTTSKWSDPFGYVMNTPEGRIMKGVLMEGFFKPDKLKQRYDFTKEMDFELRLGGLGTMGYWLKAKGYITEYNTGTGILGFTSEQFELQEGILE